MKKARQINNIRSMSIDLAILLHKHVDGLSEGLS